jgi:hypothetical protein
MATMTFINRLLLGLVFTLSSVGAQSQTSGLAQVAAAMQPGEWRVLSQGGDASGWGKTLLETGGDTILNYADKGLWNPNTREMHFLGKGANGTLFKFITFTESTNKWVQEPKPYWDCSPSSSCLGHGYEHSTIDPATGNIFWRPYNSAVIYKWTRATRSWAPLPSGPNPTIAVSIQYFPELGGFVLVGAGQIHLFRESSNKWVQVASGLSMGEYHTVASYNPVQHIIVFGGGGSRNLYKLDSALKVTAIQSAPVNVGIQSSVFTVDPASGRHLLYGSAGGFYQYDVNTNTWTTVNAGGMPSTFPAPDSNKSLFRIAVPISSYGVIAFLTDYYATDSHARVFIYKHAPGSVTPLDTTAPSAPTLLTVQ